MSKSKCNLCITKVSNFFIYQFKKLLHPPPLKNINNHNNFKSNYKTDRKILTFPLLKINLVHIISKYNKLLSFFKKLFSQKIKYREKRNNKTNTFLKVLPKQLHLRTLINNLNASRYTCVLSGLNVDKSSYKYVRCIIKWFMIYLAGFSSILLFNHSLFKMKMKIFYRWLNMKST